MSDEKPKRTSKVTKGIQRTLWTAKYEGIVISTQLEETIEWDDIEEKHKKEENLTKYLVKDFKKTARIVLSELGLNEVKAFAKVDPKKDSNKHTLEYDFDGLE